MIIPLFNALLYHYRRLLAANLAFIAILGISTVPGLHAHSIWLMVVAIIITAASYLMALARRASTERYEILFAQSPWESLCISYCAIVMVSPSISVSGSEQCLEQLTGLMAYEVVGRKASELFPTSYKANLDSVQQGGTYGSSVEF